MFNFKSVKNEKEQIHIIAGFLIMMLLDVGLG